MTTRIAAVLLGAWAALSLACARPAWLALPDVPDVSMPSLGGGGAPEGVARVSEVEVVESDEVVDFYTRASQFYQRLEGRRCLLPDGSERYLVDEAFLMDLTRRLGARPLDPLKTTVVQDQRCMTTWVVRKTR